MSEKILEVKDLVVEFSTDKGTITAVNGVNFEVYKGRTIGIVGESGSGKSVSALAIMGLVPNPPGRVKSGLIKYRGENLLDKSVEEMRKIRGNKIAMIFQEPMTSLNPVFTVGTQIDENTGGETSDITTVSAKYNLAPGLDAYLTYHDYDYKAGTSGETADDGSWTQVTIKATF